MATQSLKPTKALEMYLTERDGELAEKSLQSHEYRLNHFVRWCDENQIDDVSTIDGMDVHEYRLWRTDEGDLSPASVKTQMDTLRVFVKFLERIEAVEGELHQKVHSPTLSDGQNERDVLLEPPRAQEVLDHLSQFSFASRHHVILHVLWRTGIRMGALRAIDVDHYDGENARIQLEHRPEEDTPLKNKDSGERYIAIHPDTCALLDAWIEHNRPDVTDDDGREPLIATDYGRISRTSIRETAYRWTRPCVIGECPHDREKEDCEAMDDARKRASKCPSSVSPHAIRRGSITRHLSDDVPEKVVSDRMNVGSEVLDKHYDRRSEEQKVEQRRDYL